MKVVWTDEAKVQLDGIYQYIQHDAPLYATQMVDKLTRRVDQLTDPPARGASCPNTTTKTCASSSSIRTA